MKLQIKQRKSKQARKMHSLQNGVNEEKNPNFCSILHPLCVLLAGT